MKSTKSQIPFVNTYRVNDLDQISIQLLTRLRQNVPASETNCKAYQRKITQSRYLCHWTEYASKNVVLSSSIRKSQRKAMVASRVIFQYLTCLSHRMLDIIRCLIMSSPKISTNKQHILVLNLTASDICRTQSRSYCMQHIDDLMITSFLFCTHLPRTFR